MTCQVVGGALQSSFDAVVFMVLVLVLVFAAVSALVSVSVSELVLDLCDVCPSYLVILVVGAHARMHVCAAFYVGRR